MSPLCTIATACPVPRAAWSCCVRACVVIGDTKHAVRAVNTDERGVFRGILHPFSSQRCARRNVIISCFLQLLPLMSKL